MDIVLHDHSDITDKTFDKRWLSPTQMKDLKSVAGWEIPGLSPIGPEIHFPVPEPSETSFGQTFADTMYVVISAAVASTSSGDDSDYEGVRILSPEEGSGTTLRCPYCDSKLSNKFVKLTTFDEKGDDIVSSWAFPECYPHFLDVHNSHPSDEFVKFIDTVEFKFDPNGSQSRYALFHSVLCHLCDFWGSVSLFSRDTKDVLQKKFGWFSIDFQGDAVLLTMPVKSSTDTVLIKNIVPSVNLDKVDKESTFVWLF